MSHHSTARWSTALVVAVSVTAATAVQAQLSSAAGVGASLQRQGGGLWESLTRIEPATRLDNPWLQLGGTTSFVSGARQMQLERGSIDLVAETPAWNGLRLSSNGQLERHDALPGFARSGGTIESALSYGSHGRGAWLGLAAERTLDEPVSRVNENGLGLLRMGLWQQLGPVSIVFGSAQHQSRELIEKVTMSPRGGDSLGTDSIRSASSHVAARRWSDTEARLLWSVGRVALDGRLGFQSHVDSSRAGVWGQAAATVGVSSRLSLVGSVGRAPSRAWAGIPGARFASLGVRIAPASLSRPQAPVHVQPSASRFVVRPAETGTYVVTISVPAARTVELSGDFNSWHPVSLKETRPDVWEVTVPLAPGTYHVNMRVNGASWIAPPGLSQAADDFNGTVGLLVVR